ncbi:MAG TPA: hypothetical protein VFS30_06415 [Dehalococcoidia bacterium]|nr:hypothetical protein [Dehalococcoidia bacterium]
MDSQTILVAIGSYLLVSFLFVLAFGRFLRKVSDAAAANLKENVKGKRRHLFRIHPRRSH